jgi:hypothetical protein
MPNTELTNTGFYGHDQASMLLALAVNTRSIGLSDHKRVRTQFKVGRRSIGRPRGKGEA